jgi:hypothetical protein
LFIELFGTNKDKLPFTIGVDVAPAGAFSEYYVIGIAPNIEGLTPALQT